jgi:hypothetical protein
MMKRSLLRRVSSACIYPVVGFDDGSWRAGDNSPSMIQVQWYWYLWSAPVQAAAKCRFILYFQRMMTRN